MTTYAKKVKDVRAALGYTQEQLADRLGVHRYTINKWETGKSFPQVIYRKKIEALENGDERLPRNMRKRVYKKATTSSSEPNFRFTFTRAQVGRLVNSLLKTDKEEHEE